MPLGIYISVPFCRTKCTFCNFASGVVSRAVYARYTDRVCAEIAGAESLTTELNASYESKADSLYLGGGTPTVLDPADLGRIFAAVHDNFEVTDAAEITVECAPGTLNPEMLHALLRYGVNRVSLGVQSFIDQEARSVGRLHTRAIVLDDLARFRAAGIDNISIDLIAGLPHQTPESWCYSLDETIASAVPHVSVYMLEVDDESRLGSELIAGGARYHAHFVPDDDATADFYLQACEQLESAGIHQYEISNFARPTVPKEKHVDLLLGAPHLPGVGRCGSLDLPHYHSRHNLKYWTRQPYLGFGVDAHSMLPASPPGLDAVRFSTSDNLERYLAAAPHTVTPVSPAQAMEERVFLGLRLNRGINLDAPGSPADATLHACFSDVIRKLEQDGLLHSAEGIVRLTPRGRLLSNEVFERFLNTEADTRALP